MQDTHEADRRIRARPDDLRDQDEDERIAPGEAQPGEDERQRAARAIVRKTCSRTAPKLRHTSRKACSRLGTPAMVLSSTMKNTPIATIAYFDPSPIPKRSSGRMAVFGIG